MKNYCDGDPFGEVHHFKKQEYALFCHEYALVLYETYILHKRLYEESVKVLDAMDAILPNLIGNSKGIRRVIFDFIGDIYHPLFGTARAADVYKLRKQIQRIVEVYSKIRNNDIQMLSHNAFLSNRIEGARSYSNWPDNCK